MSAEDDVKLVVCYMVEGDEDLWRMSYESIKDFADAVVVVDGNAIVGRSVYDVDHKNLTIIRSPYPHDDKGADGKQRNVYLAKVKEKFPDSWVLVLDADEIVEKPELIKPYIRALAGSRHDAACPTMRHFVWNLACEDATLPNHFVPMRLFKVNDNLVYPEVEHNVLSGVERYSVGTPFVVWHFGYAREVMKLRRKYFNHVAKSNIHSQDFLTWWYHAHLFGEYPTKPVARHEIPDFIKKYFGINDDYLYFKDRGVEVKHWEDAAAWVDYFKPKSFIEFGCGLGHRVRAMLRLGVDARGVEISQWAVEHSSRDLVGRVAVGDVTSNVFYGSCDLVVAYDVLEHVSEEELDSAILTLKNHSKKHVLVSIPFAADEDTGEQADPNLYRDHTHKTFRPRSWWIKKFASHGLGVVPTPSTFNYARQLLVMEVLQ